MRFAVLVSTLITGAAVAAPVAYFNGGSTGGNALLGRRQNLLEDLIDLTQPVVEVIFKRQPAAAAGRVLEARQAEDEISVPGNLLGPDAFDTVILEPALNAAQPVVDVVAKRDGLVGNA